MRALPTETDDLTHSCDPIQRRRNTKQVNAFFIDLQHAVFECASQSVFRDSFMSFLRRLVTLT